MLYYVTGNKGKFNSAKRRLNKFNIKIKQKIIKEIEEPQDSDIAKISTSKALQAYEHVKKPVIVNDSGWYIPALNGFPGPYMAFVNKCFEPQDFLNLMQNKKERQILLKEVLTYKDEKTIIQFSHEKKGEILNESKGKGIPSNTVITLSPNGDSIAQKNAKNINSSNEKGAWEEFGEWFSLNYTN